MWESRGMAPLFVTSTADRGVESAITLDRLTREVGWLAPEFV
jgi:hypothetical protein